MTEIKIVQLPDGSVQITVPPGTSVQTTRKRFDWDALDIDREILDYHARTGAWPNSRSHGMVAGAKTWQQVHFHFAEGGRESLQEKCRRLGDVTDLYRDYTLPQYEHLIREYHQRTGGWPGAHGPDCTKDGVLWSAVDFQLRKRHKTTLKVLGVRCGAPANNVQHAVSKRSRGMVTELDVTSQQIMEALEIRRPDLTQPQLFAVMAYATKNPHVAARIVSGEISDNVLRLEILRAMRSR